MTTPEQVQADLDRVLVEAGEWFEAGAEVAQELRADPSDLELQARAEHVEFMYDVSMLTAQVLSETLALLAQPVEF